MGKPVRKRLTTADISSPLPPSPPSHSLQSPSSMFQSYCTICDVELDQRSYSKLYCSQSCCKRDAHVRNSYLNSTATKAFPSIQQSDFSSDFFSLDDVSTFPMEMPVSPSLSARAPSSPASSTRNSVVSLNEPSSRSSFYSSSASAYLSNTPSVKSGQGRPPSVSRRYSNIAHYYNRPPSGLYSPLDGHDDLNLPELEGTSIGDRPVEAAARQGNPRSSLVSVLSRDDQLSHEDHSPSSSYKSLTGGLGDLASSSTMGTAPPPNSSSTVEQRPRPRRQSFYIRSSQHLCSSVNSSCNNGSTFSLPTSPMQMSNSPKSISLVLPRQDLLAEHSAGLEYEFPKLNRC